MSPGILRIQPIYETAPFPSCHAATLCETSPGELVAAFFGGVREGAPDASIYVCRMSGGKWSPPVRVADGVQPDGSRFPCWNPVLLQPRGGPLVLFYKVGPNPSKWWGMRKTSEDRGRSWSDASTIGKTSNGAPLIGPAKNKPVQLADGRILAPTSVEHSDAGWQLYFEVSEDNGRTFTAQPPVEQGEGIPKATQPTILVHSPTTLQALARTTVGRICETWSQDAGRSWSRLTLTDLPNCNSGIDAVTLRNANRTGARHVLAYNHSNLEKVRYPLHVATSPDGRTWHAAAILEHEPPGQYSYPCIIQSSDELIHVAYTFKRRTVKHAMINPDKLDERPISEFVCPPPGSVTHRVDAFQ